MIREKHTGSFHCYECNKIVCNTYEQEKNLCWKCSIKIMSKKLKSLSGDNFKGKLPEPFKTVDDTINDTKLFKTVDTIPFKQLL